MSEHSVVILNVNDDPATRYVISHALRQSGYQVREAVNGAEALACVPSCDLVLLDIQLPDMDGFEVCRRIREQTAPRWLPVIHVSGVFVEDDHHVESLQGGADAYLTYPIPPNVLRATISAFLRVRAVEQRLVYEKARAEEDLFSVIAEARCLLWRAEVLETGAPFVRWRVQVCDEQAAQRFFPVNQVAGCSYAQAWYEARPLEDRVRTDTFASAEVRAGRSYSQEYRCRRQDGELRWMREDVRIETIGPGSWRAVGVCLDVTEQKRYEQVLAARASLAA
ncbi:MAG: pleD, partial [Armatimonadetes bacterium]|nr:pleD [Armatimonadota bacterium]